MTSAKTTLHDPIAFAAACYSALAGTVEGSMDYAKGEELALENALNALRATVADAGAVEPALQAAVLRQIDEVSDRAFDYGTAAHAAGVGFGARAEALRRAIVPD